MVLVIETVSLFPNGQQKNLKYHPL